MIRAERMKERTTIGKIEMLIRKASMSGCFEGSLGELSDETKKYFREVWICNCNT